MAGVDPLAREDFAEPHAMRRKSEKEQKLNDNAYLLKAWHRFNAEQLAKALAGPHGKALDELIKFLDTLPSKPAAALIEQVRAGNWERADANTRAIALREVNAAIVKLREAKGLPCFSDSIPWANEKPTAFEIIRGILTPVSAKAEKHAGDSPAKQRHEIGEDDHVK
jgi:hypothetical protein